MIVIPGGLGGVESVKGSRTAMELIKSAWENGVAISAICAGPTVLYELGLLEGVSAVCYPGMEEEMPGVRFSESPTCVDGRIITGRGPGAAIEFGFELLGYFKGSAAVEELRKSMICS